MFWSVGFTSKSKMAVAGTILHIYTRAYDSPTKNNDKDNQKLQLVDNDVPGWSVIMLPDCTFTLSVVMATVTGSSYIQVRYPKTFRNWMFLRNMWYSQDPFLESNVKYHPNKWFAQHQEKWTQTLFLSVFRFPKLFEILWVKWYCYLC